MFCEKCGAEIPDDSKHCKECGAELTTKGVAVRKSESNNKWIIGCCIGVVIIFLLVGALSFMGDKSSNNSSDYIDYLNMSEEDFKGNCSSIDYALIDKNPTKYIGDNVVYSGEVFQIQESGGVGMILLSTGDYGTDLIYVDYMGSNDFVEGDHITVYGVFKGSKTYDTRMGSNNSA